MRPNTGEVWSMLVEDNDGNMCVQHVFIYCNLVDGNLVCVNARGEKGSVEALEEFLVCKLYPEDEGE